MFTIPIQAILAKRYFTVNKCYSVYLIRDGNTVIYIGKSRNPLKRLFQHFGHLSRPSLFYLDYKPYARHWTVELYTIEECEEVTGKRCRSMANAEIAMIQHFHPCANTTYNLAPSAYPPSYKSSLLNLDNNAVDYLNF
jgi:predicted GIY-YIG superfamily endonuclease